MTLRPTRTYRWAYPVLFVGVACFILWGDIQSLIHGTPPDAVPWWVPGILAAVFIGIAALFRTIYIRLNPG